MKRLLVIFFLTLSVCVMAQPSVPTYELVQVTGTDTYTATVSITPSLADGFKKVFHFNNANTGASTFKLNTLAQKDLRTNDGSVLTAGFIVAGSDWWIVYNVGSDQYRLLGGAGSSTSYGTGVQTALGVNVGSAGSIVVNGGALGTPSSGTGTNLTGTASGLTAGNVTTNANLTGDVTSVGNASTYNNIVPSTKGGAGSITGILKADGSGTVTAAIAGTDYLTNNGILKGQIINEDFNSSFSNYTTSGTATWSIVSNMLQAVGGTTFTLNNYASHSAWGSTSIGNYSETAEVVVGTIGTNTHGVGIGFQSTAIASNKSVQFIYRLNTANIGQVQSYVDNSTTAIGGVTYSQTAVGAVSATAGDRVRLRLDVIGNDYIFTVKNLTTDAQPVTLYRTVAPTASTTYTNSNTGQFSLYIAGGTHSFDLHQANANELVSPDVVFVGNSITRGAGVINKDLSYPMQFEKLVSDKVMVWAGGGNRAVDLIASDVIKYTPRVIIINIGINDVLAGRTTSQITTDIQSFITALGAGYTLGTNVFVCELLPHSGFVTAVTNTNAALKVSFAAGLIETNKSFNDGAGGMQTRFISDATTDVLHPNALGHKFFSEILYQHLNRAGLITPKYNAKSNNIPVYSYEGYSAFGKSSFMPVAAGHFIDPTYQIFFGSDAANPLAGGNLLSTATNQAALTAGAHFNGTSVLSDNATNQSQLFLNSGDISFRTKAGVSIGSVFSWDTKLTVGTLGVTLVPNVPWISTVPNTALAHVVMPTDIATSGTAPTSIIGDNTNLNAGYTGSGSTSARSAVNFVAGTNATYSSGAVTYAPGGNKGFTGSAAGTTIGINTGLTGRAQGGNTNYGNWGTATVSKNSATNVGGAFFGLNTGTSPVHVGVFAALADYTTSAPSLTSAALIADNGGTTSPIQLWRDNATITGGINDGGSMFLGGTAITGSSFKMDVQSTTQGFGPPRMTTTQKNAISSPGEGLIVYDLTLHKLCVYTGSAWETITSL